MEIELHEDVRVLALQPSGPIPSPPESPRIYDGFLTPRPTVFVVDPDPATGKMVKDLLQGYKLTVQGYAFGSSSLRL